MKRNTRKDILAVAKQLFNERGFNAVSTGDIASALGISKGNLTYYFNKKEEIMAAILEENTSPAPPATPKTLVEMDAFFTNMQKVVQENAFYFWHHAQLSQLSPEIHNMQISRYQINAKNFTQALHTFHSDGFIREEAYQGEYEKVIDVLLLANIYWMPFCALKQIAPSEIGFRRQAWAVLYPLLTEEGKKELEKNYRIIKPGVYPYEANFYSMDTFLILLASC